jgi:phenylpyruvate tautomerase PptA (4-oxalocrotonate tautomerase family)
MSAINFSKIIRSGNTIKIPSYQRAYGWGEKQINEFVNDLIEIRDKKYYYGHFIVEKDDSKKIYEIIDGQQRITTFYLFVLSLKLYNNYEIKSDSVIEDFILKNQFQTIEYDQERFVYLVENIILNNKLIESDINDTSSIKRIIEAIQFFGKIFKEKKELINEDLLNTLLNAEVSIHFTEDKKVAVQIFELQNSRGLKLDLIEKVKALLMKEIYLNSENSLIDVNITEIQNYFSNIYHLEEKTKENSFRGELTLENILFHHLRVIDDGDKMNEKQLFYPSYGNTEETILKYIKDNIDSKLTAIDKANYIIRLSELYFKSVEFICTELIEKDKENPLIGDCIILDRYNSIELYLILNHNKKFDILNVNMWEKLLFTSNFHDEYKGKSKRDNYQWLFGTIINIDENNEAANINTVLEDFLRLGFRRRLFEDDLQGTYAKYIQDNKFKILSNGFNFRKDKIIYLLYKYEIYFEDNKDEIRKELRILFTNKLSVEHILPQTRDKNWVNDGANEKSEFHNKVDSFVNGIGNLLLLSGSENSSEGNTHPKDKEYKINNLGSYKEHSLNKSEWENSENWEGIINTRGEKIYTFLIDYFGTNIEKK